MYESSIVYLGLFVDDGMLVGDSMECIESILNQLREEFEITVGDASRFVGVQISRDRVGKTPRVYQEDFTKGVLNKFDMSDAKPVAVPAFVVYIAFSANSVTIFLNKHIRSHWLAVKRIFMYLRGTQNVGISYKQCESSELSLIGYSDADFANDVETRRSVTGYVFTMSTWSSQQQILVTLSTTEAEYVAAATASRELVWLRKLMSDIKRPCVLPTELYVDNQGAIKLVKNAEFHKRTKLIDIRYHFLHEKQESGELSVRYVPTELQKADVFTKALARARFYSLCNEIGLSASESTV